LKYSEILALAYFPVFKVDLEKQFIVAIIRQNSEISNIYLTNVTAQPKLPDSIEAVEIGIYR